MLMMQLSRITILFRFRKILHVVCRVRVWHNQARPQFMAGRDTPSIGSEAREHVTARGFDTIHRITKSSWNNELLNDCISKCVVYTNHVPNTVFIEVSKLKGLVHHSI